MDRKLLEKKLCLVKENRAYFVEDFENVTGDDWNDIPYQCNAGNPYKEFDATVVYFDGDFTTPADMSGMFITSAGIINSLEYSIPWIYHDPQHMLLPGATLKEFIEFVKSFDGKVFVEI